MRRREQVRRRLARVMQRRVLHEPGRLQPKPSGSRDFSQRAWASSMVDRQYLSV